MTRNTVITVWTRRKIRSRIPDFHSAQTLGFPCHLEFATNTSRTGYCQWRKRPPSERSIANACLDAQVTAIHEGSQRSYGPEISEIEDENYRKGNTNAVTDSPALENSREGERVGQTYDDLTTNGGSPMVRKLPFYAEFTRSRARAALQSKGMMELRDAGCAQLSV